ncbi:MAG: pentapeptide repeat-containing protein [Aestuariibaculum sp.]
MDNRINALENENRILKERLEKIQSLSKKKTKKRNKLLKFIGHTVAGKRLKKSIYNFLEEYNVQKTVTRETISDLLASIMHRLTRIGLLTLIFAVLPSALLFRQNMLMKQQNKKIQDQTYLAEASRRSAQMFIMGEVLSDVNTELNASKSLSDVLVGRIVSLSHAMKPYRYLKGNELVEYPVSPERGQLLITLAKSDMNVSFFVDRILQESNFTQAELTNASLPSTILRDVNLMRAKLSHSNLENVDFSYAVLSEADLSGVDLTDAILRRTDLSNANLSNANLSFANVTEANFTNANLHNVKVDRMDWLDYVKDKLKPSVSEELRSNYKVDSVYFKALGKKHPALIRK